MLLSHTHTHTPQKGAAAAGERQGGLQFQLFYYRSVSGRRNSQDSPGFLTLFIYLFNFFNSEVRILRATGKAERNLYLTKLKLNPNKP
jgi:hypothetical protein